MRKNYIVKKGFVSSFTCLLLVVLLLMIQIGQIKFKNVLMLKKYEKKHMITLKAYQFLKQHCDHSFDMMFMDTKIKYDKNKQLLQFLNMRYHVECDAKLGLKMIKN